MKSWGEIWTRINADKRGFFVLIRVYPRLSASKLSSLRRPRFGLLGLLCCLCLSIIGLTFAGAASVLARPLAQSVTVVSPADITTPTPTPLLKPTPVAPPHPTPLPSSIHTYTVRPGDTLLKVALEIGVDLNEMPCVVAPDFAANQPLVISDTLEIPLPGILCHEVQNGETLDAIATQYGVAPEAIYHLAWNHLGDQPLAEVRLKPGLHLRIPTIVPVLTEAHPITKTDAPQGFLPYMLSQSIETTPFAGYAIGGPGDSATAARAATKVPANWPYGSGHFFWPVYGWLTQTYRFDHRAVDIAATLGTPVTAADRGVVLRAGWNNQGYGLFVVIDHNIDYVTLYAHLSEILVKEGDVVAQGQVIGKVGSTGNSTGPHLHFEIRDFGRLTNPLELLGK